MKIDLIAGARPNFMKIAPIIEAIEKAKNEGKDIQYCQPFTRARTMITRRRGTDSRV